MTWAPPTYSHDAVWSGSPRSIVMDVGAVSNCVLCKRPPYRIGYRIIVVQLCKREKGRYSKGRWVVSSRAAVTVPVERIPLGVQYSGNRTSSVVL